MNRSKTIRLLKYIGGVFALVALLSPSLIAQKNEVPQLRQKVAELENRLERLEAVFKKGNELQKEIMGLGFRWQNKKNWRRLEIGMTESEVENFLGGPTKIIEGVRTLWYYPDNYCGYVSFDKNGYLTGWNEP